MASVTGTGYPIARTTGLCAASGRQLQVGERYVVVLLEVDSSPELQRRDFSLEAWQKGARPELTPGTTLFASWHATVAEPNAKKGFAFDQDEMLDLFDQLGEATDSKRLSFRYLLALMLIRKRALKYDGQRSGVMLVRRPGPALGEPMQVIDPGMDQAAIASAVEQLGEMMGLSDKESE